MTKTTKTLVDLRDSRLLYEQKLPAFGYMIIIIVVALLIGVIIWSLFTPKIYIIRGSGIVESVNKNYIMSAYSGEISNIQIQNGDYVEEGDTLFAIKSTDLDLQKIQIDGKIVIYEKQISQLEKLENAIKANTNSFNPNDPDDKQYYNQYQAYKAQVAQNTVDVSMYQQYGYSEEQIETEIRKNDSKNAEIYYSTLRSIGESINSAKAEMENLKVQGNAITEGQSEYIVTARTSGIVHLSTDYKDGMVIQGGSVIGSIASENDTYIVKAYINVNDMPRIELGNSVDIAVAGLLESVYGTLSGKLVHVDSDISQQSNSNGQSGSESGSSYFRLDIEPDSAYLISKSGRKYNITNGTVVETRIKYDEVTYFVYFLESLGLLVR
jgi:multidrug resistance efflux pump